MGYDVVEVGYNYRLDEPRAALLSARLPGLGADIEERRRLTRRYRELLAGVDGLVVPYSDEQVAASSCYVMPVMLEDADAARPGPQAPLRAPRGADQRPLPVDQRVHRLRPRRAEPAALRAGRAHPADPAALSPPRRGAAGAGGRRRCARASPKPRPDQAARAALAHRGRGSRCQSVAQPCSAAAEPPQGGEVVLQLPAPVQGDRRPQRLLGRRSSARSPRATSAARP